jgi:ornithine cyclodeaminase
VATIEILFLNGHDVERLMPSPDQLIDVVEAAVRAQGERRVVLEPRVHLIPDPAFNGHFNLLRAYIEPLGVAGVKIVGDYHDNYKHGYPSEFGLLTLYEPHTGVPLAIVDATEITDWRTGALSALGARHLARGDSKVLGHVGARGTAFANVVLLDRLFDFDEIRVTSRRAESRDEFGRRLQERLGKEISVCDTMREVVEGADIVVEATRLEEPEPLLKTAWLKEGVFFMPYGTMSTLELDVLSVMDKVLMDDWGQAHAGNFGALRAHINAGLLTEETLYGELGDVVCGRLPGRERDDERILFWHRGLATTDVAVGQAIYKAAVEQGVGTKLHYRD